MFQGARVIGSISGVVLFSLLAIAASPAAALVTIDLHYQGRDEIELSELPVDGRITLDVDVHWDGLLPGLLGIGVSTRFDRSAATFVGGTLNVATIFANEFGGDGFSMGAPPRIVHDYLESIGSPYAPLWAINEISTVNAIRLTSPPDNPGSAVAAYSLTFDVHDVVTFDVLFGQGDALLFKESQSAPLITCVPDGTIGPGNVNYGQTACIGGGLVSFDGFQVVDRGRVASSPTAVYAPVPEPSVALLVGMGLFGLGIRSRSGAFVSTSG